MTPKEKALDLVNRMYYVFSHMDTESAKQCALIAVDEILSIIPTSREHFVSYFGGGGYVNIESNPDFVFWILVKQEIEKL